MLNVYSCIQNLHQEALKAACSSATFVFTTPSTTQGFPLSKDCELHMSRAYAESHKITTD